MSSRDLARRTRVEISFAGTDITASMLPYFLSLAYTDNQEDEADDLQITFQDTDGIWLEEWLNEIVDAASSMATAATTAKSEPKIPETVSTGSRGDTVRQMQGLLVAAGFPLPVFGVDGIFGSETRGAVVAFQQARGLTVDGVCGPQTWEALLGAGTETASASGSGGLEISAVIVRENWNGDGADDVLETGAFILDKVDYSGPPTTVKISSTSLPFTSQIRQTKKTKGWEQYTLSGIANEMASTTGMTCMYLTDKDPFYARVEQYQTSDIDFLKQLCHDAGCSLKATNKTIVIFDQADYESKDGVRTIVKGDGSYTKFKLMISTADVQYQSCRVFYNNPATGTSVEATAYDESYDSSKAENQQLNVFRKVGSIGEAKALAEKLLRLHNKYFRKVQITFPGDPTLLAGLNIVLSGWGGWDGKYSITKAAHSVGSSGYTTTVTARKVLEEVASSEPEEEAKKEYDVGDVVTFNGGNHYVSSTASSPTGGTRSSGPAKITYKNPGSAHPWHLVGGAYNELDGSCNVYGWVDEGTFS